MQAATLNRTWKWKWIEGTCPGGEKATVEDPRLTGYKMAVNGEGKSYSSMDTVPSGDSSDGNESFSRMNRCEVEKCGDSRGALLEDI